MIEFDLQGNDFIPLNNLLKLLNLAQSGGEANQIIVSGNVKVNDSVEFQKRKKIKSGDRIIFQDHTVLVK